MKSITLKGLPGWLLHTQLPMWIATPISGVFAALFALIVGRVIMRLSGIAASIATFGLLGVVNNVYSNWDSVTGGQGSIVGTPATMNVWIGWLEFRPTGRGKTLKTGEETSQPNKDAVAYWASGLEPVYLEGALDRAK